LNNNLLFIAPSNSVHSFKWINFFYTNTKFQITWISFYKKTITQEIPDKINYFELTGSNPLKIFFKLKDIYFKKDFFCTHLHYIGRYSYLLLFLNIKNLIISPWGSDIKLIDKNIFKKIIVKTLLESSKLLTVDANFMKDLVIQLVKKPLNIKRINFGTDTDIFDFNNKNSPIENIKIISLRSLEKLYSIDTLIKAAKILKQKKIKFEIDIYGKGSEKESLIKLINKLQLEGSVNLKVHIIILIFLKYLKSIIFMSQPQNLMQAWLHLPLRLCQVAYLLSLQTTQKILTGHQMILVFYSKLNHPLIWLIK